MKFPYTGTKKYCCICNSEVDEFLPWKHHKIISFTRLLNVVGSDTLHFYCPKCKCADRDRHLWLFVNEIGLYNAVENTAILYIAPENFTFKLLKKTSNVIVGDLYPEHYVNPGIHIQKIDLTDLQFADCSFDLIVANHVLEHIPDYERAIREIYRSLKKGGAAIVQTPYSSILYNHFEDPMINTDLMREQFYGQNDHVRVLGMRLFDDFKKAGFNVRRIRHSELLKQYPSDVYGVNPNEDLMLIVKPLVPSGTSMIQMNTEKQGQTCPVDDNSVCNEPVETGMV